jgi:hypothetical protein
MCAKTIAVLGLAFKPNTDDVREAPALALITALQDMGAATRAYDPAAMEQAKRQLPDVVYCEDAYSCAERADALVIATEWEQFRALDLVRLKGVMTRAIVVDLRNIYSPETMKKHGFVYTSIGRTKRSGDRAETPGSLLKPFERCEPSNAHGSLAIGLGISLCQHLVPTSKGLTAGKVRVYFTRDVFRISRGPWSVDLPPATIAADGFRLIQGYFPRNDKEFESTWAAMHHPLNMRR